jgi:hypothetical protein
MSKYSADVRLEELKKATETSVMLSTFPAKNSIFEPVRNIWRDLAQYSFLVNSAEEMFRRHIYYEQHCRSLCKP